MNLSTESACKHTIAGQTVWAVHSENKDAESTTAIWICKRRPLEGTPPSGILRKSDFAQLANTDYAEGEKIPAGTLVMWETKSAGAKHGIVWAYVPKGIPPVTFLSTEQVKAYNMETTNRIRFNPYSVDNDHGRYILKMTHNPRGGVPVMHIRRANTVRKVAGETLNELKSHPGKAFSPLLYGGV